MFVLYWMCLFLVVGLSAQNYKKLFIYMQPIEIKTF